MITIIVTIIAIKIVTMNNKNIFYYPPLNFVDDTLLIDSSYFHNVQVENENPNCYRYFHTMRMGKIIFYDV